MSDADPLEAAIDDTTIIHNIRSFVSPDAAVTANEGGQLSAADVREAAGCLLWDLSTSEQYADIMCRYHVVAALEAVLLEQLSQGKEGRDIELCLGIAANLQNSSSTAMEMAQSLDFRSLVVDQALLSTDALVLGECCRLLSAAVSSSVAPLVRSEWAAALSGEEVHAHVLFIAQNTLQPQLQQRSLELLGALLRSGAAATQQLLAVGVLELVAGLLQDACRAWEQQTRCDEGTGWEPVEGDKEGDEGTGAADASRPPPPTDASVSTALSLVEAVCAEEGGGSIVEECERLRSALLALLLTLHGGIEPPWSPQLLMLLTHLPSCSPLLAQRPQLLTSIIAIMRSMTSDDEDGLLAGWYLLAAGARQLAVMAVDAAAAVEASQDVGSVVEQVAAVDENTPPAQLASGAPAARQPARPTRTSTPTLQPHAAAQPHPRAQPCPGLDVDVVSALHCCCAAVEILVPGSLPQPSFDGAVAYRSSTCVSVMHMLTAIERCKAAGGSSTDVVSLSGGRVEELSAVLQPELGG